MEVMKGSRFQTRSKLAAAFLAGAVGWSVPALGQDSAAPIPTIPSAPADYGLFGVKAVTRPSRDAVMGFSIATQVKELAVKGGEKVKLGQLLMRGDDEEDLAFLKLNQLQADTDLPVQRAKAAYDLAKLEFERTEAAFNQGGSSQQEVDRARLTLEGTRIDWDTAKVQQAQAAAQVDRAKARVDRMNLKAPFDGQVESVSVDVGQSVNENDKVIRVVNVDLIWIDVPVPMERPAASRVRPGDPAWALTEIAGAPGVFEGRVIEVSPVSDPASRTRRVRVEIVNPPDESRRLIPGEPAWVRFEAPGAELLRAVGVAERSASAGGVER